MTDIAVLKLSLRLKISCLCFQEALGCVRIMPLIPLVEIVHLFWKKRTMATQITLTLPDELYENAQQWALLTQRDLTQTLTDALKLVLTPVSGQAQREKPVAALSDPEILALAQIRMDLIQGERLGKLLEKQREDRLLPAEQTELLALMQVYNQLWLRQSEALAEAVRRGLRGPLVS